MPVAVAAEVLHGGQHARANHVDHARTSSAVKRTRSPGCISVGGLRAGSKSLQIRAAEQLPAAGRRGRIDARLLAADADRARRHFEPRRGAARHVQRGVEAAHVREARLEAEEEHDVLGLRVTLHDFIDATGPCAWRARRDRGRPRRRSAPESRFPAVARVGLGSTASQPLSQLAGERFRSRLRADRTRSSDCSCPARPRRHAAISARAVGERPHAALALERGGRRRFADKRGVAERMNSWSGHAGLCRLSASATESTAARRASQNVHYQ